MTQVGHREAAIGESRDDIAESTDTHRSSAPGAADEVRFFKPCGLSALEASRAAIAAVSKVSLAVRRYL